MKNFLLYVLPLVVCSNVCASEVDYDVYSDEYQRCIASDEDGSFYEQCNSEEYFRIKKQIEELKIKLERMPELARYNSTELSLPANIENMQKYNEIYCKYMYAAAEKTGGLMECKKDMANVLYVDLYKIYDALLQKRNKQIQ